MLSAYTAVLEKRSARACVTLAMVELSVRVSPAGFSSHIYGYLHLSSLFFFKIDTWLEHLNTQKAQVLWDGWSCCCHNFQRKWEIGWHYDDMVNHRATFLFPWTLGDKVQRWWLCAWSRNLSFTALLLLDWSVTQYFFLLMFLLLLISFYLTVITPIFCKWFKCVFS